MNSKTAKALRKLTQYRNATATPRVLPFPGIARMYERPVFEQRIARESVYVYVNGKWKKEFTDRNVIAHDRFERPIQLMRTAQVGDVTVVTALPKIEMSPVTRPARIDSNCARGKYRTVKQFVYVHDLRAVNTAMWATASADIRGVPVINLDKVRDYLGATA